jgi:hypothetical protein
VGVNERLTISFADAERRIQGVAIDGVGTLLRAGEQLTVAAPAVFARAGDSWQVSCAGEFELSLAAWGAGASLGDGPQVWPCGATGTVGSQPLNGLALLTSAPTAGSGVALERSLAILFDASLAFAVHATRPPGARGHGEDQLAAVVFRGDPPEPARVERPRLSGTYDAGGELAHVGMELWESEESDRPLRIGGEAQARGVLAHPDGSSTHVTFVAWHHDGRHGLGSYSITQAA